MITPTPTCFFRALFPQIPSFRLAIWGKCLYCQILEQHQPRPLIFFCSTFPSNFQTVRKINLATANITTVYTINPTNRYLSFADFNLSHFSLFTRLQANSSKNMIIDNQSTLSTKPKAFVARVRLILNKITIMRETVIITFDALIIIILFLHVTFHNGVRYRFDSWMSFEILPTVLTTVSFIALVLICLNFIRKRLYMLNTSF